MYCIFHYSAHNAPLPMQILIYLFIGAVSLVVNMICFIGSTRAEVPLDYAIIGSFVVSALCNYLLCIAILFRHKARWSTGAELWWYAASVFIMGAVDYGLTHVLIRIVPFFTLHWGGAKLLASIIGFIGNFAFRKLVVFTERRKTK